MRASLRTAVLGLITAIFTMAVGLTPMVIAEPVAPAFCGTPLSADELDTIAQLSDTSTLIGNALQRLETAVARHREITEILVAHRDRRGLFPLGLDGVEQSAVMPLQRDPGAFLDPEYAHAISLELLRRFLVNVHAAFTGAPVEPQWARYFELARRCEVSPARVAMAGYNAHLSVDLAYSVATVASKPENAPDYFKIVDAIAASGQVIIDRTKEIYNGDLGPLWRFYFVGEGLDLLLGAGVATGPLLRAADLGYNVVIYGNGLALEDPGLHNATAAEIRLLGDSVETALDVLTLLRGL
ncbi:DUF5995 family protein [Nocardia pseudovaccinii]|uniref:DUF5995 family protein n=1 Tax=Nocardia pseudovaccinii TaxID=189540 RepID=UPI00157CC3A1|nr:DUF5995 family protein [Nocardia pseudovaccinii]